MLRNKLSTTKGVTPTTDCKRPKCFPCSSSSSSPSPNSNSRCWSASSTYCLTCIPCKKTGQSTQYWGETGHTSYRRGFSHWTGLVQRSKGSVLHQHAVEAHGGRQRGLQPRDFQMRVIGTHPSNISRQVHEGILISQQLQLRDLETRQGKERPRQILNSRTEFMQPRLIRPWAVRILY